MKMSNLRKKFQRLHKEARAKVPRPKYRILLKVGMRIRTKVELEYTACGKVPRGTVGTVYIHEGKDRRFFAVKWDGYENTEGLFCSLKTLEGYGGSLDEERFEVAV